MSKIKIPLIEIIIGRQRDRRSKMVFVAAEVGDEMGKFDFFGSSVLVWASLLSIYFC